MAVVQSRFIVAFAIFLACAPIVAQSQEIVLLSDASSVYRLDDHVRVFIDSTNVATIEEVSGPDFQTSFLPSTGDLTFGYLKSAIWLKVSVRPTNATTKWYIEIPAPFLEFVDFYQHSNTNSWDHIASGYFRKNSEKDFAHTSHVLPLRLERDSVSAVYIRIGGVSPKTFPLYAISAERFIQKTRTEDLGYGIFFGILLLMFVYNVYIYATLRQVNYFLYVCIIGCTLLIFGAVSGYGGKFVWPEKPLFNYINGKLMLEVLIIFLTIYTVRFLEVRKYSKLMYYLLTGLVPLAVIALILTATGAFAWPGNSLIMLSTIIYMATAVTVTVKGNKSGRYFIAAWSVYFLGGFFMTLRNSGLVDYNFWTTHFVEIGAVLGTTIIGSGLAAQYRRLKKEKEDAQDLALKIQQEATAKLGVMVDERTEQLHGANRELQATLEMNRKQTQIIESKNAELDAFVYRISHDLKGPISSSLGLMALAKLDIKDPLALEYIDKQYSQLERLSHLISGLVNLTNLNNAALTKERIDFDRMIDECIMSFNTFKNFPRLAFEKRIERDVEFYSEWTLLNAILQNLIENAIKYCRGEAPYVSVSVRNEGAWLVIQVEDNGQGIRAEHQSRIFDMFYRGTQEAEGSGLGLYILKRSVDRLKGTIKMYSEEGVGSTFIVRLPHANVKDAVLDHGIGTS